MSAHHWGKAFAKRWVLHCVSNIVGLRLGPCLTVRALTNGDVSLHFLPGWVIPGWGWGGEEEWWWGFFFYERYCLFGMRIDSFLGNPPTMCKKTPSLKYLVWNGTWCMPRYGRKCFLVVSRFWEMVTLTSLKLPKVPGLFASDPMCSIMVCLRVKAGILAIPQLWWV